ncbi:sigma factor-like helix-turn-helix DNA-binding protein [uncultured Dysosmobacter sp.]|uniref:sigma factor-like helix-turn-helix DNA-binding protein n=1 Tax=uncultured Dysosmobacter sp. TaxID=2591384 RepID=UPI00262392E1|nr:sigma factor-like helix-turn-helix DNA-binding protein [uncultured Dysosmobacter sp.]
MSVLENSSAGHEWLLYDLAAFNVWKEMYAEDNADLLKHLKANLKYALKHELTQTQRAYLTAYYSEKKTIQEIAKEFNVESSTVSRSLKRVRQNLAHVLQYTSPHLLGIDIPASNKPNRIVHTKGGTTRYGETE